MEYSYTIPNEYRLCKSNKKRILKDAFADMLPKNFFNAPKSGFEIPIGAWFRSSLKNDLYKTLSADNLRRHSYLNIGEVHRLMNAHISGSADYTIKLWVIYCFQKWYNNYYL
jgi:asparagine synthase (glutamine-hydrolysing)